MAAIPSLFLIPNKSQLYRIVKSVRKDTNWPTEFDDCMTIRHGVAAFESFTCMTGENSCNALANQTRKSMQVNAGFRLVFNLLFVWPPTCVHLTCVDFGQAQIRSQVDASFNFQRLDTQHRSTLKSGSQVICICFKCTTCVNLLADLQINPFGHPSQVRA